MLFNVQEIANQFQNFDTLYIFFQDTTKTHDYYKIVMLREALSGFDVL